jgi:hypothetical protein
MDQIHQSDLIFYFGIALVVSAFILYVVVRSAVSKETKETVRELKVSNRLKYLDLKRQGLTDDEIKAELNKL